MSNVKEMSLLMRVVSNVDVVANVDVYVEQEQVKLSLCLLLCFGFILLHL